MQRPSMLKLLPRLLPVAAGLAVFALLVAACGSQDSPTAAIQNYLNARVAADETKMVALTCKDQESLAETEAASFKSLNAKLNSVSCSQAGTDGQFTLVACQGSILTTYNGETTTRDLAGRNFRTIQEDGQWKFCGYPGS